MIKVRVYDDSQQKYLEEFCQQMLQDGYIPWSSLHRLWLKEITYFVAYYQDKIIAITGAWQYLPGVWIPLTRVATLKQYRNLLVPTKTYGSASIPTKLLWLPALNYCLNRGAKQLITHVNKKDSGTGATSFYDKKTDRLIKLGLCRYEGTEVINQIEQDKFTILMPTYKIWLEKLKAEPLRLRNESI